MARHCSNGISTLTADHATIGDGERPDHRCWHPAETAPDGFGISRLRAAPDIEPSSVSGFLKNPTREDLVTDVDAVLADVDPVRARDENTDVPLTLLAKPAGLLWVLRGFLLAPQVHADSPSPNGRAFSGEPSEQSERPERRRGRRVRCNAMLGLWRRQRDRRSLERVIRFVGIHNPQGHDIAQLQFP